ncbi:ATP-grasp domain-containing protein [Streptomyces sp. NPDC003943]
MNKNAQPPCRPPALLLITDLVVICRHLQLLTDAESRGLAVLAVVGPETPADRLAAHRADPAHPLSRATEVVHVPDCSLDTLVGAVHGLLRAYDVKALLNCGEVFAEPAGTLAEALGLPGPGAHAARVSRNKVLQRLAAPDLAPRWTLVGAEARAAARETDGDDGGAAEEALGRLLGDVPLPAVLKPAGRMSSSGVRAVDTLAELGAELAHYPEDETLLLEERARGAEYSVEALVYAGETVWAGVTAKDTNECATRWFTETGHTSPAPALGAADEARLLAANARLLDAIGFGTGMSHAEFRLGPDGVVLMEVAVRPPGDAITKLWHLASGRPLEPALLDLALGERPLVAPARRRARQLYLDHPHGALADVTCDETAASWITRDGAWPEFVPTTPDAPPRLCAVIVTREPGDRLGELTDSGGRAVSIVVDAPEGEDIHAVAERFAKTVRVRTQPNRSTP